MRKRIYLVLALMALSTAALLGFQFYWSFQAYRSATRTFQKEIDLALAEAVEQEAGLRRQDIVRQCQAWLSDTSTFAIKCFVHPLYQTTQFTLEDRHPLPGENREPFHLSFADFTQALPAITPEAKAFFIKRFTEGAVTKDVRAGMVYFYTRRFGDKLEEAFSRSHCDVPRLRGLFRQQLRERDLQADFRLVPADGPEAPDPSFPYATRPQETGLRKMEALAVRAWFPPPNAVFLRQMRGVLLSSLLLTGIVLFCFAYTVRTLLRQKKLAELKNDFVNNMTHELKTPVTTISVAAEAIQSFVLPPATAREYLGIIGQQAGQLSGLIDQILNSVALEQDRLELARQKVSLPLLLDRVLAGHRPQMEQAQASITKTIAGEEELWVTGDEQHLANVIANLLDNALKYGGGAVAIDVRLSARAGEAVLEVSDTGIGVPARYREKVFEKFFRVPAGDVHNAKGYGLGLSYARAVLQRHGGSISLRAREPRGSTFTLTLPLALHGVAPRPAARG